MLSGSVLHPYQDWGGDFAGYILQARSIAEDGVSSFVSASRFVVENSTSQSFAPVTYPWGFPLLLAPAYALFGLDMIALKCVPLLFHLLLLALLWFGFAPYHPGPWRIALVALFAFNPYLLTFLNRILSDVPFLFFSTLTVLVMVRIVVDRRRIISPAGDAILLGTLLAASFFIRSNGALLLPTLLFVQLIRSRQAPRTRKTVRPDTFLPYVWFALCLIVWRALFPNESGPSVNVFTHASLYTIKRNILFYWQAPADFFLGFPVPRVLFIATFPLLLVGAWKRRGRDYPIVVYSVLTALLYVAWPYTQGLRYAMPLLPFFVSFTLSGLQGAQPSARERARVGSMAARLLPAMIVLFFMGRATIGMAWEARGGIEAIPPGPYQKASRELFSYVRDETPTESVILFFKPRVMLLYTGRRSLLIDRPELLDRGDYLCIYPAREGQDQLSAPEVDRCLLGGLLEPVYENSAFRLYRVLEREVPADDRS